MPSSSSTSYLVSHATSALVICGMALKDNLIRARKAAGLSQPMLSKLSGVSQQLISQIETGVAGAGKDGLPAIAAALKIDVTELQPDYWERHPVFRAAQSIRDELGSTRGGGSPLLPLFAAVRGGEAELVLGTEAMELVSSPLDNVRGAYLVYVVGESMEPLFEPGDQVLVNPNPPPRPGSDVILQTSIENGERHAMVKRLIRVGADEWQLEQFNPSKRFKVSRKEWPTCHLIVGKYSRR